MKIAHLGRSLVMGAAAMAMVTGWTPAANAEKAKAVVELFTSQGCSYCPAADDYFFEISQNPDLLTLAFHVDYWDYLGWKDTFGSREASDRQRGYAEARGDQAVYTPQMVLNGASQFTGNNQAAINTAIAEAKKLDVDVETSMKNDMLEVSVEGLDKPLDVMADVYFLQVMPVAEVKIARGENAGKTRRYTNIVKSVMPIGVWDGTKKVFQLPKSALDKSGKVSWVVLVQTMKDGFPSTILGATAAPKP
ncbi:DUF1223 domain-containing protein [Rhodobacteraceae bacterium RKSG542]|uniref:DUF1223 domain-containing protein n=1 Tax=Pseudovibrio flavus TaxID=2529854 RepID=UPI0012BC50BA|nr:DUF1223 domain-containing protein [Pseudovibrio flavus]MTI18396.1 DUF1223 domain-containing protein [Pseudovibrio flavus]